MTTRDKLEIIYYYRGGIERGTGNSYSWRDGYSANSADGSPLFPWSTQAECREEAKRTGGKAVFYRHGKVEVANGNH